MDKIELLSPVGNMESFYAAIQNGADALYLGGKFFNARSRANNFSVEEIEYIVRYAHVRGVKVYVTVNILISDKELERAIDFLNDLYLVNVDGVIIQDIGLASIVKQIFPKLNIHASTQMTVYNLQGIKFLKDLGFSRAVLARETSLEEAKEIIDNSDIEIEIFGHGALCISYSGQCLLSSMIGNRSGNRGNCAQPCRLPYELVEKTNEKIKSIKRGYLISPKDLCSLNDLAKFNNSKITSLKIEGRMKTPQYVGIVTRIYRKYIDSFNLEVSSCDFKEIKQIFNRGGFTRGYIDGHAPCNMISTEKPKNWGIFLGKVMSYKKNLIKLKLNEPISIGDGIEVWNDEEKSPSVIVSQIILDNKMVKTASVGDIVELGYIKGKIDRENKVYKTSDKKLNQSVRTDKDTLKRVGLCAFVKVKMGEKLSIKVSDDDGNVIFREAQVVGELAVNKPLTKDRVVCQLGKTGDKPFYFSSIDVDIDDNVVVPISEINNIRRLVLEELEGVRGSNKNMPFDYEANKKKALEYRKDSKRPDKIALFFYETNFDKPFWELDVCRIYLPLFVLNCGYIEILNKCREKNIEVCLWTPSITRRKYDLYIEKNVDKIKDFDGVLCGNVGTMEYLQEFGVRVFCDYSFNVFNGSTAKYLEQKNVEIITLSNELTLSQINDFTKLEKAKKEILVYGNLPVMTSEYCVVGDGKYKDGICPNFCHGKEYYLKDRKEKLFKIGCDPYTHRMTIFNSDILFFGENVLKLRSVDSIRLNILDEDWDYVKDLVELHNNLLKGVIDQSKMKEIENKDYTRGHLYREV